MNKATDDGTGHCTHCGHELYQTNTGSGMRAAHTNTKLIYCTEGKPAPSDVTITVTRSAGADGAVVVFIDTAFEPDGSDGGPALRVLINDHDTYAGKAYAHQETEDRSAASRTLEVRLDQIAYIESVGPPA